MIVSFFKANFFILRYYIIQCFSIHNLLSTEWDVSRENLILLFASPSGFNAMGTNPSSQFYIANRLQTKSLTRIIVPLLSHGRSCNSLKLMVTTYISIYIWLLYISSDGVSARNLLMNSMYWWNNWLRPPAQRMQICR